MMNRPYTSNGWIECSTHTPTMGEKHSCLECGVVMPIYGVPYVRNITHYKELYSLGKAPRVCDLLGDRLKEQVIKFQIKQSRPRDQNKSRELVTGIGERSSELGLDPNSAWLLAMRQKYSEYINFLANNQDKILPRKKDRKRSIQQIYGEHRILVLEYLIRLLAPPE